jgi:mannose-6-phosphate isomerase-like protein (cupin superfamily)
MPTTTITIPHFATGPTPPRAANPEGPNTLRTRVAELVAKMGPPPWSRRVIQDERQLVTLIANRPGGGNRPHWHADFDEWWVVLAGELTWELTGGIVVDARKDDIVWVPRGTVHHIKTAGT